MPDKETDWSDESRPMLFELRMPLERDDEVDGGVDRVMLIERTPDENAARMAFDACRKVLSYLRPRPKASLELYLGEVALDVFEQTKEGDEFEPLRRVERT